MLITNELLLNSEILKGLQILVVDNDRDTRDLYAFLLESYGATVTVTDSIKDTLEILNSYIPNFLICEMRFLGESVSLLIQKIRCLALRSCKIIPIIGTSTCSPASLVQQSQEKVEVYLLKPIDIDYLIYQVWNLTLLSRFASLSSIPDPVAVQNVDTQCIALPASN